MYWHKRRSSSRPALRGGRYDGVGRAFGRARPATGFLLQGRLLGKSLAPSQPRPAMIAQTSAPSKQSEAKAPECASCHPLSKQISTPRRGYWHFERAHTRVLEKQWACAMCHSELTPFQAASHKIDRMAQVQSCVHCHAGN